MKGLLSYGPITDIMGNTGSMVTLVTDETITPEIIAALRSVTLCNTQGLPMDTALVLWRETEHHYPHKWARLAKRKLEAVGVTLTFTTIGDETIAHEEET